MVSTRALINIHAHHKSYSENEWVLRNAYHFLDADVLRNLNYPVSVGVHPWQVRGDYSAQCQSVERLLSLENVLAVGEIGLDRVCETDFTLQKQAFEKQLELAKKYNKPVIIHAVKTYSDLMPYIKLFDVPFIMHQYRGNAQQTAQFLQYHHVYFSFGKDIIEGQSKAVMSFQTIPQNKIFLETDVSKYQISDIYRKASQMRNISMDELQHIVFENFRGVFKNV